MHSVRFTDDDLNLLARALDTLSEKSQVLKNGIVAQVQAAQREAEKPPPKEKKK